MPGQAWRSIVRSNGTASFAKAFVGVPVLEASVLERPWVGVEEIGAFLAAASGIYDSLEFTHETNDGSKTYLEWQGTALGMAVSGCTILTRDAAGLIESIQLHHRPLLAVERFSTELAKRIRGLRKSTMSQRACEETPQA